MQKRIGFDYLRETVLLKGLCCGCGACVGVCQSNALTIGLPASYLPVFEKEKCNHCGMCAKVCPGKGYPVVQWSKQKIVNEMLFSNEFGPVLSNYLGHSTNEEIRLNSASGGVATSLLLFLLKTKRVDEVLVVNMKNGLPQPVLTNDTKTIRDSMMSKYGPVPVLSLIIPELLRRPRKIALTATPCHLGGLFYACEIFPKLKESIVLTIGLFCGQVQDYDSLASIAASLGLNYPDCAEFVAWRHGKYPGSARFRDQTGAFFDKPLYSWLDIAIPHFSLRRCFLCPDGGNWLSDVTLGDIHAGGVDETVVVCRSKLGEKLLIEAAEKGEIFISRMEEEQANKSVIKAITRSKLLPGLARNSWLKNRGLACPDFDYVSKNYIKGKTKAFSIIWVLKFKLIFLIRKGWIRKFLLNNPWWLEKIGHFLNDFPNTIPGWKVLMRFYSKFNFKA